MVVDQPGQHGGAREVDHARAAGAARELGPRADIGNPVADDEDALIGACGVGAAVDQAAGVDQRGLGPLLESGECEKERERHRDSLGMGRD